jgi:hypothetical protein
MPRLVSILTLATLMLIAPSIRAQSSRVSLGLQDDEARAALTILDTLAARAEPSAALWNALWESDGYRRLKKREAAIRHPFTDSSFAKFLRADTMAAGRARLAKTLREWRSQDLEAGARQALEWLPAAAHIKATVYILIKPLSNSFVFEMSSDPAIMLFLDPAKPAAEFTNQVVHELHHVGFSSACVRPTSATDTPAGTVRSWLGAFGEGLAMLAAAGGPDVHPHAVSRPDDRARWDHDMANFDRDLHTVERFMSDVLDGRLVGDSIRDRAVSFYGVQGPWYTVGWQMAAVVAKEGGREALVAAMCDPVQLLTAYNAAEPRHARRTGGRLATWDPALLARLSTAP